MSDASTQAVHRWAVAAVVATFFLIIAGALVTSRDAGLAVPDWPLSFGSLNPPRWYAIENIRTEHGHRLAAACVALFTVVLAWRIRRHSDDPLLRRLGGLAVFLVLVQALLGGLRVLHLSLDLAMMHGWLGQAFFCLLVAIATLSSRQWSAPAPSIPTSTARLAVLVAALVVAQLVLGIFIRHLGLAARPLVTSSLFYSHLLVAVAILWGSVRLVGALAAAGPELMQRRAQMLLSLVVVQVVLGVGAFAVTEVMRYDRQATALESWLPTLHVALGAAVLATSIVVALHACRGRVAAVPVAEPGLAGVLEGR